MSTEQWAWVAVAAGIVAILVFLVFVIEDWEEFFLTLLACAVVLALGTSVCMGIWGVGFLLHWW